MKIGFPQFLKLLRDSQISRNWRNDPDNQEAPILIEKCAILLYSVCFIISNLYTLIGHSLLFFSNYTFPSFPYFFFQKKRCQIHLVQNCIRNRINLSIFLVVTKLKSKTSVGTTTKRIRIQKNDYSLLPALNLGHDYFWDMKQGIRRWASIVKNL